MRKRPGWLFAGTAAAAVAGVLAVHHGTNAPGGAWPFHSRSRAGTIISSWPQDSRRTAALMIERYGPPDRASPWTLAWESRKHWKRVTVHRAPSDQSLEQAVSYAVPLGKTEELTRFGHGLAVEPGAWELSARNGSEAENILVLNLADDIARGRRTAREAEAFFDKAWKLHGSGKTPPYTAGLRFLPASGDPPPLSYRMIY